jgi:hypothetical protein
MRRFMVLVTLSVTMAAMFALTSVPALAAAIRPPVARDPAWGVPVEATSACQTVAGVAGFEWRSGGEVCWLTLPVPPPAQ